MFGANWLLGGTVSKCTSSLIKRVNTHPKMRIRKGTEVKAIKVPFGNRYEAGPQGANDDVNHANERAYQYYI